MEILRNSMSIGYSAPQEHFNRISGIIICVSIVNCIYDGI